MRQGKRSGKIRFWNIRKTLFRTALIFLLIASAVFTADLLIEKDGTWHPDYPLLELGSILDKEKLTDEDYHILLMQTGLGKDAVDELFSRKVGENRERAFEKYQQEFFAENDYQCTLSAGIVHEERLIDKDGKITKGFEIPSLKNGDILITKATHTVGWRHGHAAIVTDASKGETLEAILLGNPSQLLDVSKWQSYPSFILLRLKNAPDGEADKIAAYAKKHILNVQYGLLTGIPEKAPDKITKTQCSHLVWYPYQHFGYDLDSDGSWLVTPKDIANSDLLEVVQVFGVNPEEIWP
jgi:uncharacterized protein YycO